MSNFYKDLSLTNFPDSVDQFTQFLNILASDGTLLTEYQKAMAEGNEALANTKLEQIPAYRQKLLTAQDLNKFIDATIALERFYKTDIKPYVNIKQAEWQKEIDNFTYVGSYSLTKDYLKNNYVSYGIGSSQYLYIALDNPPQGTIPTDSMHWRQLTVQGKPGEPGIGVNFNGAWDGSQTYNTDNCVEYDGALWGAIKSNIAQVPIEGSPYWKLIYRVRVVGYPVSVNRPIGQEDGALWFRIVE